MLSQWLWIMGCYAEPVVVTHGELCCARGVNHCVLCWASGCESWCANLSHWLCIMLCYAEPVVVNHYVLFWTSGCESWCIILSQWLWIRSITHHVSQPLAQHRTPWLTTTLLRITHHDSQPLAHHNSPWFTTTAPEKHNMIHNHWLRIIHHDSQPLVQNNT
jgi:hypothetical protein